MSKEEVIGSLSLFVFLLVSYERGLLPVWIVIFDFMITSWFLYNNTIGVYSVGPEKVTDASSAFSEIAVSYVSTLKAKAEVTESHTVNCSNCGGPNVNKIVCDWCGKVL